MSKEQKDNFVTLINPQGDPEQVWDFADGKHVENLLAQGWTRPDEPAAKVAKTNKEP
ncbi:MAG: hypothetical protein HGB35_00045 [Geobacteraceae bacterium]|nr:hypothetical protein [Geobacteraceae bacterium]